MNGIGQTTSHTVTVTVTVTVTPSRAVRSNSPSLGVYVLYRVCKFLRSVERVE